MCAVCKASLKYCGNTTNPASHIQSQHPLLYAKSLKSRKGTVTTVDCVEHVDHDESESGCSSTGSQSSNLPVGQLTITDSFQMSTKLPASSKKAKDLNDSIGYFIAKDMLPISVVEGKGFKHLMNRLEPRYQVPHRSTFMGRVLPKLTADLSESVKAITASAETFALTTDCWTSRANCAFAGVTFHTISSKWELVSVTLENQELSVQHTAENLAEALTNTLERWKLQPGKLSAVTVDNASNIQKAVVDILNWRCIGCFGHTINLCVKAGMKQHQVKTAMARCSRLVTYFRKSSRATHILAEKQEALGTKKHKLLQDVDTRWNSTLDMICRFIEQQSPICATLVDQKRLDLLPKDNELKLLEDMIAVLKPFKDVTMKMSADTYVTISAISPLLHHLLHNVLTANESDSTAIRQMKQEMKHNLTSRYQAPDVAKLLNLACFLDPRFKNMPFLEDDEKEQVNEDIVMEVMKHVVPDPEESTQSTVKECQLEPSAKKAKVAKQTGFAELLGQMYSTPISKRKSIREKAEEEVKFYLQEASPELNSNVLHWWKVNQHRFTAVAAVAKKMLCIPATSTPSERLFSTAGDIINAKRASLDPDNASMLCFLAENLP